MAQYGEDLLVAAVPELIELGQEFPTLPPHMTVIGWLSFDDNYRRHFDAAAERIFRVDFFQETVGGKAVKYGVSKDIPVRAMNNVEEGPWYGLHSLASGLRAFPPDDAFIDVFSPHVTDTPDYKVKRGERIAFPNVVVFDRSRVTRLKMATAVRICPTLALPDARRSGETAVSAWRGRVRACRIR